MDVDKLEFDVGGSRFVIRRLRKYTKYEIVVQAVNTFGEGPLSIPSIGQTQEDGKCNVFRPFNCLFVFIIQKTEVQTVILKCLTSLNLN